MSRPLEEEPRPFAGDTLCHQERASWALNLPESPAGDPSSQERLAQKTLEPFPALRIGFSFLTTRLLKDIGSVSTSLFSGHRCSMNMY